MYPIELKYILERGTEQDDYFIKNGMDLMRQFQGE